MVASGVVANYAFWFFAAMLFYVYCGYGIVLSLAVRLRSDRKRTSTFADDRWPSVSVLLTVHNEELIIEERLRDLVGQDYPSERMDILVCSDGSTDNTEAIVSQFGEGRAITLIRSDRLGKSGAQNAAMRIARGDVVVLTDAEASFAPTCVRNLVAPFADERTGCTTANLQFIEQPGAIAAAQGFYWSYELHLRNMESQLGILAVASGQAMALRRSLFRELPPFVGDDCLIPLDIVEQGFSVVHCPDADAYDVMANEESRELKIRARMTLRNWTGTWLRSSLVNPIKHPGYAFALWSHKLLRWLGSGALVGMAISTVVMLITGSQTIVAIGFVGFMGGAAIGWWASKNNKSVPIVGTIYSFFLANCGFLIGLSAAVFGRRITAYRSKP